MDFNTESQKEGKMSSELWFDDVTQRHILGRFIDIEAIDAVATGSNYDQPVMKQVLAIEIRPRSRQAGARDSTTYRIKPNNRDEMIARFPKAWEAYEAEKAGRRLEVEKATPLNSEILGTGVISTLTLNGFGSEERFLAMSDLDLTSVLGERGVKLRDTYRTQTVEVSKHERMSAPANTPIEIKGPIDELTFNILQARAVALYEEIAAWDETAAWAYLGAKGPVVRAFARAELNAKALPAKTLATTPSALGSVSASARDEKQPEHSGTKKRGRPRKNTFGVPLSEPPS